MGGVHFFIVAVVCSVYWVPCSHRDVLRPGIHMLLPVFRFGDSVMAVDRCAEDCPIPDELSHGGISIASDEGEILLPNSTINESLLYDQYI